MDGITLTVIYGIQTLAGLSSDTKPLNVPAGTLFIETNSLARFQFDGTDWNVITGFFFFEDFVVDGWTDIGTDVAVNTGTKKLDFNTTTLDDGSFIDMAGGVNLSDTEWVMRMPISWTVLGGTTGDKILFFGPSDSNSTVVSALQDTIGFFTERFSTGPVNNFYATSGNGVAITANATSIFTNNPSITTWYIEVKRLSATSFSVEAFSDATFETSIEIQTPTISSSIIGLNFLKGAVWIQTAGDITHTGTMDAPIEIKDGTSVF